MYQFKDIITNDKRMLANIEKAMLMKDETFPIMIYGETGTGKELFTQAIHSESIRRDKPFIAQNCSNLPESIFESLLWGVEKGAFTGAIEKMGLFEEADGGTLFIDEINSLSLHLQAKLLRVLENFKVLRVGATRTRTVNVRILTAMNDTPQHVIENSIIRKDLFYRLASGCLGMIPLRDRKGDIGLYTDYFIKTFSERYNKSIRGVSNELENIFLNYNWPGNVREIMHNLESACCITKGNVIQLNDLPEYFYCNYIKEQDIKYNINSSYSYQFNIEDKLSDNKQQGLANIVSNFEKEIIEKTLIKFNGNITRAAKFLGIPRQTLKYKIDRYGILIRN